MLPPPGKKGSGFLIACVQESLWPVIPNQALSLLGSITLAYVCPRV